MTTITKISFILKTNIFKLPIVTSITFFWFTGFIKYQFYRILALFIYLTHTKRRQFNFHIIFSITILSNIYFFDFVFDSIPNIYIYFLLLFIFIFCVKNQIFISTFFFDISVCMINTHIQRTYAVNTFIITNIFNRNISIVVNTNVWYDFFFFFNKSGTKLWRLIMSF